MPTHSAFGLEHAILLCIYRIITMLVGLTFTYFGYQLFKLGITKGQGELTSRWISLKANAPGIFFALFGTVIVVVSLIVGVHITPVVLTPGATDTIIVPPIEEIALDKGK